MIFIVLHSLLLFALSLLTLLCFVARSAKMVGTDPPEAAGSSSGQQQVQVSLPFNLLFLLFLQLYSIKW
jgi:hypothetical protein